MQKLWYAIILLIVLTQNCSADTFTNKVTGVAFNGYPIQRQKGNLTLVYNKEKGIESPYLNLSDYRIESNFLGRKEQIYVFSFRKAIELECETKAFEKAITSAANQGPQFILINIDTPGGRVDLTTRICTAIVATTNCPVVAYISGGEFGGAYSAGAIVALACDKVIMAEGTVIGAATPIIASASGSITSVKQAYGEVVGAKFDSAWQGYCISVAETNRRPAVLVKAMIDKETEVLEVLENGKTENQSNISRVNKSPT
jgi:membrane-bound ClpP family serine protease